MESLDQVNSHAYRSRVTCASCGEAIVQGKEVSALEGITLCRRCAFGDVDTNLNQPYIESNLLVH
jgi:formylmethanofuran dehydrogenase subunit E